MILLSPSDIARLLPALAPLAGAGQGQPLPVEVPPSCITVAWDTTKKEPKKNRSMIALKSATIAEVIEKWLRKPRFLIDWLRVTYPATPNNLKLALERFGLGYEWALGKGQWFYKQGFSVDTLDSISRACRFVAGFKDDFERVQDASRLVILRAFRVSVDCYLWYFHRFFRAAPRGGILVFRGIFFEIDNASYRTQANGKSCRRAWAAGTISLFCE